MRRVIATKTKFSQFLDIPTLILLVGGIFIVFPLITPPFLSPVLVVICVITVIWKIQNQGYFRPLLLLSGLIACSGGLSLWISINKPLAISKLCLLVYGLAVLLFFGFRKKTDNTESACFWTSSIIWSVLLLALIGPLFLEVEPPLEIHGFNPWFGRLVEIPEDLHRNTLASLLVVAILLQASRFWTLSFQSKKSYSYLIVLILLLLMLVFTASIGALVACLICVSILILVQERSKKVRLTLLFSSLAILILMSVFVHLRVVGNLQTRFEIWERSIFTISAFPLTGIGLGSFSEVVPIVYPLYSFNPEGTPPHAHNLYLQIALDLGLPGFIAIIMMFSGVLFIGFKGYLQLRRSGDQVSSALLLGYLVSLISIFAHGSVDSTLWLNKPHPIIFILGGLGLLISRKGVKFDLKFSLTIGAVVLIFWGVLLVSLISSQQYPVAALGFGLVGAVAGGAWIAYQSAAHRKRVVSRD